MNDQLTAIDIIKIKEEIEHRRVVVRKEALVAVKEARAHGDLSDNFEYYAAKKDKNKNESRIRYLELMIRTAVIVEDHSQQDEVGLNKMVEIFFEEDKVTEKYKLVTTVRGNSMQGLISIESPIGKAIIGRRVNDRVCIKVSDTYEYYIVIKAITGTDSEELDHIRSF